MGLLAWLNFLIISTKVKCFLLRSPLRTSTATLLVRHCFHFTLFQLSECEGSHRPYLPTHLPSRWQGGVWGRFWWEMLVFLPRLVRRSEGLVGLYAQYPNTWSQERQISCCSRRFQRTPSNFSSWKEVWLVDTEGNCRLTLILSGNPSFPSDQIFTWKSFILLRGITELFTLEGKSSPRPAPPRHGQGHLSVDQVAQTTIQPDFAHFQWWGITGPLGNWCASVSPPSL